MAGVRQKQQASECMSCFCKPALQVLCQGIDQVVFPELDATQSPHSAQGRVLVLSRAWTAAPAGKWSLGRTQHLVPGKLLALTGLLTTG